MKKNYILFTFLLLTLTTIAQTNEVRITTIIEGDCPNFVQEGETIQTAPRVVELYINGTVDVSNIELQSQFSFATFWTANSSIGTGEYTDSYIYIVNDLDAFDREFPGIRTDNNTIEGTILTSAGGGDKLRLIDTANNDTVLDVYGIDNTDGANETWNYENSFVKRNDNSSASSSFDESEWSTPSSLIFEGLCWGADNLNTLVELQSFTLSINDSEFANNLSIYPNPTSDILNIRTTNNSIIDVSIINSIGKKVFSGKENSLDMSNFPSGIYLLKIEDENNRIAIKKIVKQ